MWSVESVVENINEYERIIRLKFINGKDDGIEVIV